MEFVHRYTDPWDQETVALVAALLAYGNVKQIRRSVAALLARMEDLAGSPSAFVRSLDPKRPPRPGSPEWKALEGFVHRFNLGEDLLYLLWLLSKSWRTHGSLGAHFAQGLHPEEPHIGAALNALITEWRSWLKAALPRGPKDSFYYLLTAPKDGSCCKRWCMFLRWVGRHDDLDPGLWTRGGVLAHTIPQGRWLRAEQLVIPLDTHTGRISQYLGLTHRKSLNWLAALEVTESLRSCDPQDPTRYDFALSRLGILDVCQRKYRAEICRECELLPVCHFANKRRRN